MNPWMRHSDFGEVLQTGRIDVKCLIEHYKRDLVHKEAYFEDDFSYKDLKIEEDGVQYKSIKAKHIVFAEGFGVVKNPFFNNLPLVPTKGELLYHTCPRFKN